MLGVVDLVSFHYRIYSIPPLNSENSAWDPRFKFRKYHPTHVHRRIYSRYLKFGNFCMILGLSYVSGPNFSLIRSVDLSKVLPEEEEEEEEDEQDN